MLTGFIDNYKRIVLVASFGLLGVGHAGAQVIDQALPGETASLSVSHSSATQALNDGSVADAINIGVVYSPASNGLQLRAGAWKMQSDLAATSGTVPAQMPLHIDDSSAHERPFGSEQAMPQGIDLSASYVWESPRFGQFILSTKASYLVDFNRKDPVEGAAPLAPLVPLAPSGASLLGSDLQSSLTLTWQIGNHRASAVTHYSDPVETLGKLDLEELSRLVGNLTTLDLQYGYRLKAGREGEAVISVGLRSVLENPAQSLARPVGAENSGRMAYGTIKYQF